MSDPIVVDIGKAIEQLQSNPELAKTMNELAFGPFAAAQLAAREELIFQLGEALIVAIGNLGKAGDLFEDGQNEEAWEWIACAQIAAKPAIKAFNEYRESA
ncbi:hypothetical protein CN093_08985 [Sinorhizobium meliloti]|uniref:hypothetical protein n=1 Tax=Rhizobium meliloti TaxID=382 RepID=UPI000FD21B90|nr:hypothetical protein [Sinorhizobium meliloti]RVO41381.1 hypothetical protein CN093_08985 [Sinorhizobium meliloti]